MTTQPVEAIVYRYELRRAGEVLATGHMSREEPLEVGASFEIAGHWGTVLEIDPTWHEREFRLVVQLPSG